MRPVQRRPFRSNVLPLFNNQSRARPGGPLGSPLCGHWALHRREKVILVSPTSMCGRVGPTAEHVHVHMHVQGPYRYTCVLRSTPDTSPSQTPRVSPLGPVVFCRSRRALWALGRSLATHFSRNRPIKAQLRPPRTSNSQACWTGRPIRVGLSKNSKQNAKKRGGGGGGQRIKTQVIKGPSLA
jgi:hypothetical protein